MGLVDRPALRVVLEANRGRKGAPLLRRLAGIGPDRVRGRVRSHLEARFREFVVAEGLPEPEANVLLNVEGDVYEADFVWRGRRLIVELDGRAAHDNERRFETDRERDRRLAVHGWETIRVTSRQLDRRAELRSDLRSLLAGRRSNPDRARL